MTLWATIRFEFRYQSHRASTWIYCVVLLLLTTYIASEISTDYVSTSGIYSNDTGFIAAMTLLGSLMGLLIVAALAGDAATRDGQTRMDSLLYTTPISKGVYLAGRFVAAFALYALCLTAVPIALLIVPLLNQELAGPFRPVAYLDASVSLLLVNAFISTAVLFAMAALSRRAIASYVGAFLLFAASMFNAVLVEQWQPARLLDPMGMAVLAELGGVWTPTEKSTQLVGLDSSMLANRLTWLMFAVAALAVTHLRFRLAHHVRRPWFRVARRTAAEPAVAVAPVQPRHVPRQFGAYTHVRQTLVLTRASFVASVRSWGIVILAAIPALVVANRITLNQMGVPLIPTTERMTAPADYAMFVWLLTAFCAGELMWREREARMHEIADAAPVPEWVLFLGRLIGVILVIVTAHVLVVAAGIFSQELLGYHDFQIGLYGRTVLGLRLIDHLPVAVLALAVHTFVNNKYVAHVFVAIAVVMGSFQGMLGIEHNLLVYGASPGWTYSDMRGFDPFLGPWLWFTVYWAGWAALLAVAATVFSVRGVDSGLRRRLEIARRSRTPRRVAWAASAALLTVGGFIFYNTNVLNAFATRADTARHRADYERQYGRYRDSSQPDVTAVTLNVEIFPERRVVEIRGTFHLVNDSEQPIDAVHIGTPYGVDIQAIEFDRSATVALSDEELHHRVYALERPLQPGEGAQLRFAVRRQPRGFTNSGIDPAVVSNGSYFRIEEWLPAIGYRRERELRSAGERRAHKLADRPSAIRPDKDPPKDSSRAARAMFEAVVGTNDGQLVIAPGSLRRTWTRNGRQYFHYATEAPIPQDYAFFSARYAVREAQWNDVSIQIVHHPEHTWNVDRMLRGVVESLEYYTRLFGPYPHRVLRVVEHPGDDMVAHASPTNISFQEPASLLNPAADTRNIDLAFAVMAHEVAHSWWGHTVTPARIEGAALLTESLAWYSALAFLDETRGRDHVSRFLGMMREAYLLPQPRGNVPLLRAEDWFLAYRKGPFAMWALRQYVGADAIDGVLRRLISRYGSGAPPLPTSLDLYRELQAVTPPSLRYLLVDLFEVNTFWELEALRVAAEPVGAGGWQVTLDVFARKVAVDEAGVETDVPMDDLIEFGVFPAGGEITQPQHVQARRVRSGRQRVSLIVPMRPDRAAIDPRNLLIDLDTNNNIEEIARERAR